MTATPERVALEHGELEDVEGGGDAGQPGLEAGAALGGDDRQHRRVAGGPDLDERGEDVRRGVAAELIEVVEDRHAALAGDHGELGPQAVLVGVVGGVDAEHRGAEDPREVAGDQGAAAAVRADQQRRSRAAAQEGVGEAGEGRVAGVQGGQLARIDRGEARAGAQLGARGRSVGEGAAVRKDRGVGGRYIVVTGVALVAELGAGHAGGAVGARVTELGAGHAGGAVGARALGVVGAIVADR
nr:hypothetical protein [Nannocystis sp.]